MAYDHCHCSEVCRNYTITKYENIEDQDNYKIYNFNLFKKFFLVIIWIAFNISS